MAAAETQASDLNCSLGSESCCDAQRLADIGRVYIDDFSGSVTEIGHGYIEDQR